MSLIKAAGSGEVSTGFYKLLLDQSLKFNDDDSQYLTRTPASAGNRKTWTWSGWVKRGNLGVTVSLMDALQSSGTDWTRFHFNSSDKLAFAVEISNSNIFQFVTTQVFRDTSAWYHIVAAYDSTQTTSTNRFKLYVNGEQITAFDTETYGAQNTDSHFSAVLEHNIGAVNTGIWFFDGYMAEINLIDGTALTAASFGETKDGIWIPKDTSGLTFGTNGFHLTFKDDVVSEGFNTVTYTGNGGTQSISGLGFSPAFVWAKRRDDSASHVLYDIVRGTGNELNSNNTNAEATGVAGVTAFDGDGFTLGNNGNINDSNETYVGWCWEAGGTPTADNSAGAGATPTAGPVKIDGSNLGSALGGSIAATRISANTARGFSIISFAGNATAGATVAHSLNSAPEMLILKNRDSGSEYWTVFHTDVGNTKSLFLNSTGAVDTSSAYWNNTSPTSSVFSLGGNPVNNGSGNDIICYAFHSVSGYSKIDTYTGNGSSTGPTVTTGFRPAWVMVKRSDSTGNWYIWDTTRHPSNPNDNVLYADVSNAESVGSSYKIEVTATGFQIKHSGADINASSGTFIYMAFADTREAAFFKDVSTNGNHFTPVNLDYRDSVPDVPTNNFAVLNATFATSNSASTGGTLSEGNLKITTTSSNGFLRAVVLLSVVASGIFEGLAETVGAQLSISFADYSAIQTGYSYIGYLSGGGLHEINGDAKDSAGTHATYSAGDIIGVAVDVDAGKIWFAKNNTYIDSGNPAGGANAPATFTAGTEVVPYLMCDNASGTKTWIANFGQDSSFSGAKATANSNADANGHGSFAYAPPSGYLALCSQNLPDAEIIDGTEYFNTLLWTGDGSNSRTLDGLDFTPSFIWHKSRSSASMDHHAIQDVVRGFDTNNNLYTSLTASETDYPNRGVINSVSSTGFTFNQNASDYSTADGLNQNNSTFVAWNWLAGTAFSNDASATSVGTIDSSGQVNTKAGFSIVSYTGTGSNGTVAHGLGSVPKMIIFKVRNTTDNWTTYHAGIASDAETDGIFLNLTNAAQDQAVFFNDTAPTSSVFSISTNHSVNGSSNTYIAYCFADVEGYSKVGSFIGNGNADGPFVYTGFRPAWIMLKRSDGGSEHWQIVDNKRNAFNGRKSLLLPSANNAEADATNGVDFLSNGFKPRDAIGNYNTSGGTYIYLAFADQPFKFSNAE